MARPELLDEIRKRLSKGETGETIARALHEKGWSAEDIRGAFALFEMDSKLPAGSDVVKRQEDRSTARSWEHLKFLLKLSGGIAAVVLVAVGAQASGIAGTATSYLEKHLFPNPVVVDDNSPVVVNDYGVFTYTYPEAIAESRKKPTTAVVGTQTKAVYIPAPTPTAPITVLTSNPTVQPTPAPAPSVVATIKEPAPSVWLSANASRVLRGTTVTLSWSVTGATSCTSGGFDTKGALSGTASVRLLKTTSFKLVCDNQGATALKEVRVAIEGVPIVIRGGGGGSSGGGSGTGSSSNPPPSNPPPSPVPPPTPVPEPTPTPNPNPNPNPTPAPPPNPSPGPTGSYPVYSGCERPASSYARTVYVDPRSGSDTGDGSQGAPYRTLANALGGKKIQGGDHVIVMPGDHGDIHTSRYSNPQLQNNSQWIWLDFQEGATAKSMEVDDTARILITNAELSSMYGIYSKIVKFYGDTHIVLADSDIYNVKNASSLSAQQWVDASDAIFASDVSCASFLRNNLTNVRMGIALSSTNATPPANSLKTLVQGNTIKNFSADGMRPNGSDITIKGNRILDSYVTDADGDWNHDDGIQIFALNGATFDNIRIEDNWIQETTSATRPLKGELQGIGHFDGVLSNVAIVNNVILVDVWHGITTTANNSVIDHNTVANWKNNPARRTWISVDGTNTRVTNNIAMGYIIKPGVTSTNNQVATDPIATFKTFDIAGARFNMGIKPTSAIAGTGAGVNSSNQVALGGDSGYVNALAAAGVPAEGFLLRIWHRFLDWFGSL